MPGGMSRTKPVDPVAELKETLTHAKPQFKVVVMPDFYLDYILTYPGKLEDLTASFLEVAQRGGGNLLGWGHTVGRGGNASNVVAQLSKLGCEVVPIIETDELGKTVLQHFLKGVDLSHVRTTGTMSRTMSFETEHSGRRVNIMVSDPGSLSQFGPEKLTQEDKQLISEADFVCVLNWNQNLKGTDLAEKVFSIAKKEGKAVTFFDPGDPALRTGEIEGLNERVLTPGLVDLHTPEISAKFVDGQRVRVPCAKIKPVKVTGAGDVWNAADIYAQGVGLGHKDRLIFANAAGAAYLEGRGLEPPTLQEVVGRVDSVVAARKP